jgi:hypothetical protein
MTMHFIVRTKKLAATNHRGARIVASCDLGNQIVRHTFAYRHELEYSDNLKVAALSLLRVNILPEYGHGVRLYYSDFDRQGGVLLATTQRDAPTHLTTRDLLRLERVDLMEDANNFFSQETMQ